MSKSRWKCLNCGATLESIERSPKTPVRHLVCRTCDTKLGWQIQEQRGLPKQIKGQMSIDEAL